MMQKWLLIFFYVFVPAGLFNSIFSQTNADTPNLSLETGNLAGWRQYLGGFYYDNVDGQYKYDTWTEVTNTTHIQIVNGFTNQQDPVISCWNFPTNPDGITPVRIGVPNVAENNNTTLNSAMAERLSYTFLVTENTTLFTYKFATVLHVPELSGNNSTPHTGEQLPLFSLEIEIEDTITGLKTKLPCGFFEVSADINSTYGLTQVPTNAYCPSSIANTAQNPNRVREYAYRNWTTGSYNLSAQVGKRVTINILTHDCLVPTGAAIRPGSHSAYGYFWAETRKMELGVKNCGLEDAVITAPAGFAVYEWYRSDGILVGTDPDNPAVAVIPPELIKAGVVYYCKLHSELTACDPITLSTELEEVGVNIQFDYQNNCSGVVDFTNKTVIDNDKIIGYQWDFGDGAVSYLENPSHNYSSPGEYNVSLTITTNLGCSKTITQKITVRYFPNLQIVGADSVCVGEPIELAVLEAGVGSRFEWSNGSTEQSIKEVAVSSGSYTVKVTDPFTCSYQKSFWITVKPSANFYIQGVTEVCMNDTVFLSARSYAMNDNIQYIWNDGTYGADLKAKPLINGMIYSVTGTYMNGCKTTKDISITVNSLPTVTLTGESSICKGEPATLTAQGANTYNWPDLYSGSIRTVIPNATTTYSVIGIDDKGCASPPATKTVNVKDLPVLSVSGDSTVCEGKSVILTAQGASAYSWHDGSATKTFSHVPTQDTTFWFDGNLNGCVAHREIPIRVLPSPYTWIDGNSPICRNSQVTLTGKGADSYHWNTGSTDATITETPLFTSSYQLTGTALNGCSSTATIQIIVNPLPNVKITGDKNACQNTSVNLRAEGASLYYWDNGAFGDNVLLTITDTTTLSVQGIDNNGCENKASWTVNSISPPDITIIGKTAICPEEHLMLIAQGASTYVWQDGSTSSSYSQTPSSDTLLKVKGTLINAGISNPDHGCSSELEIPVQILASPVLWTTGITAVCPGEKTQLTAHGADSYQWSNGETTPVIEITPTISASYKLYGYNKNGCTVDISIPITVHPRPRLFTDGDVSACEGGFARINVYDAEAGDVSFLWSNGNIGKSISPQIFQDVVYSVKGVNQFGCENETTHAVKAIEPPDVGFMGKTELCPGESSTLVGTGATSYLWNDSISSSSFRLTPSGNGIVRLTGTYMNCPASISIPIMVHAPTTLYISGDTEICYGEPFTLYVSGANDYNWNTGDDTNSISYSPASTTEYIVTGTDNNGCSSVAKEKVTVHPLPVIRITKGKQTGCPGGQDTVRLAATGAVNYQWSSEPYNYAIALNGSKPDLTASIDEGETTVYVEGEDSFGCIGNTQITVAEQPRQQLTFNVTPSFIEDGSPNVRFTGVSPANSTWYWDAGDGSKEEKGNNIGYSYRPGAADSFLVSVRAVDELGCEYTGKTSVFVWKDFWAPTAFSPNKDDLNDNFRFFGGELIDEFTYIVYNRLGEIIFTGKSIYDQWNGTYKGEPCPWGVYGWVVQYKSNFLGVPKSGERKGFVTLLR